MTNPPGYFEKYYKKNKSMINKKRQDRYHTDSDYRERVLQASREYREKKRGDRMNLVKVPRYEIPLVYEVDGEQIELYSIGYFSRFLGRSVQSIVHWENTKPHPILPVTPYRDIRKFRYYTDKMMLAVVEVVGDKKRLFSLERKMYKSMYDEIKKRWDELGVPVNKKVTKFTKNTLVLALRDTRF